MSFAFLESATAKNPQSRNSNSVMMKLALMANNLVRTNPASRNDTKAFTANKSKTSKANPTGRLTSKNRATPADRCGCLFEDERTGAGVVLALRATRFEPPAYARLRRGRQARRYNASRIQGVPAMTRAMPSSKGVVGCQYL